MKSAKLSFMNCSIFVILNTSLKFYFLNDRRIFLSICIVQKTKLLLLKWVKHTTENVNKSNIRDILS